MTLYFAYGSNMATARLRARTPSATPVGIGHLDAHRLVFHKVGADGTGKCDVVADEALRVHGVLFELAAHELEALDRAEGGYRRAIIEVETAAGTRDVTTYLAQRTRKGLRPCAWYLEFVIAGAVEHGLPAEYVTWLRTVDCYGGSGT